MEIKIKKLHQDALTPTYGTNGAACFDLYSLNSAIIKPYENSFVGTGLAFEIPENHVMLIFSRSGHGFNHGIRLSNCVGVIDSDYRGEVKVSIHNDSDKTFSIFIYDRVAQAMIIPVSGVKFIEVDELSETTRGAGGFGSTGK